VFEYTFEFTLYRTHRSPGRRPAVSAAPDDVIWPGRPAPGLAALLDATTTAVGHLADQADLDQMADQDAAAVMAALTTLTGRLDGLRVQVARAVRDRDLCGLRGARNLAGWLRADARLADDAWKIARLAAAGPGLPQVTSLLGAGTISLAQAATACWQITQLPTVPIPPAVITPAEASGPAPAGPGEAPEPCGAPGPDGTAQSDSPAGLHSAPDDGAAGPGAAHAASGAEPSDPGEPADPAAVTARAGLPAGVDPSGEQAWAGLWRAGDVHGAADALFATFLPALDGAQLRQLGAHLREAADARDRATEDCDAYAARSLRISRSLHGIAEITGRLHPEAAQQVIAAFEHLGRKTDQDDDRTKAQRWADALTRLAATGPGRTVPPPAPASPADGTGHAEAPAPLGERGEEGDDRPSPANRFTGHDHDTQVHDAGGRRDSHAQLDGPAGQVPAGYQRPRIIVTVPLSTLLGRPLAPGATLGSGTPLTAEAARRLACDAEVIRLVTSRDPLSAIGHAGDATARLTELLTAAIADLPPPLATPSAVLDIGRKSPGWTPRQRDALHAQYGGRCAFGRCDGPIDAIHHIIHWLHGGKTRIINGFPCCSYHHWLIHEGGWRIKKHPGGTITTCPPPPGWRPGTIYRHGKPIREHPAPPGASRKRR
jgi:hypothetical protein